jgi:hypothetical protein
MKLPHRPFCVYDDKTLTDYLSGTPYTFERLDDKSTRVYRIGTSAANAEKEEAVRKHIETLYKRILN